MKSEEAIYCSHSPSSLFALDGIFTYSENYDEKQDRKKYFFLPWIAPLLVDDFDGDDKT